MREIVLLFCLSPVDTRRDFKLDCRLVAFTRILLTLLNEKQEKLVKRNLRAADVFYPPKSLGQESE